MAPARSDRRDELTSTGIAGLDVVLNGGLPRGRTHLLRGLPGTGKTTTGLQFLLAGAARGEKGIYLTLSQTADELRGIARSHGFDLAPIEIVEMTELGSIGDLLDVQTVLRTADVELEAFNHRFKETLDRHQPDRLVYDSLTEILLMSGSQLRFRHEVLRLRDLLSQRSTTSLILDTARHGEDRSAVEALVHGVLAVELSLPLGGVAHRQIAVMKMRGHRFLEGFHDFTIETGGLAVFPRIVPDPGRPLGGMHAISSGIASLDELTGGGVEKGTVCLIAGQSGVGKSTLSAAFARAAALDRQRVVIFLFEEMAEIYGRRARDLAMDLEDPALAGRVQVVAYTTADVVPGQFYRRIESFVDDGAEVVIIDSVTGLFSALPERRDALLQFQALLRYLSQRNVLVLLVLNLHGLMDQSGRIDFDLSFISDTIILLRQFDAGSSIRRTISVLKKRYGPHLTEVRELRIEPDGLEVRPISHTVDLHEMRALGASDP